MSSSRVRYWTALAGAAALVGACNQMLGIDDASVDARLAAVGHAAASAAGATASGGTGAIAGKAGATVGGGGSGAEAGVHNHGAAPGAGGNDDGSAGSDESPDPHTGGTAGHAMGGTHSGSGSAGKMSSDAGGEGGETSGDPCDDYCDEMQSECVGEAEQYRDRAQCIKICHFLPEGDNEGEGNADDANSVACRLKYVKKTQYGLGAEVTAYCRQAGPSGDGKCGTDCEAFCSVMMQVCTEETAGPNHFANEAACLTACNALPAPTVHYSNNDPAVSDGNHALCRLFHVNSAAMADPEEHCEHAMGITLCQATP